MRKVKITVMRVSRYEDLMAAYENPLENACERKEGEVFTVENGCRPTGFCESAWETLRPFVEELARGGGHFYGDWMKNPHAAMVSCNDGFRPVSFLVEAVEDEEKESPQ